MRRILQHIALVGIVLTVLGGCRLLFPPRESDSSLRIYQAEVTLAESARSAGTTELHQSLVSYSDTSGEIRVTGDSAVADIAVGQVLVGGVSTRSPEGMLRRVISTTTDGGRVVIQTEAAALEDAFESLSLAFSKSITEDDVDGAALPRGITFRGAERTAGVLPKPNIVTSRSIAPRNVLEGEYETLHFEFEGQDIYSFPDGTGIRATGELGVSQDLDFEIEIADRRLEYMMAAVTQTVYARLELACIGDAINIDDHEVVLFEIPLPTIVIPAGFVPIVIPHKISVPVILDGKLRGALSTGIEIRLTTTTGAVYDGTTWSAIDDQTFDPDFIPPTASIDLELQASVGPRYAIKLYGLAGPTFWVGPYLRVAAVLEGWCTRTALRTFALVQA